MIYHEDNAVCSHSPIGNLRIASGVFYRVLNFVGSRRLLRGICVFVHHRTLHFRFITWQVWGVMKQDACSRRLLMAETLLCCMSRLQFSLSREVPLKMPILQTLEANMSNLRILERSFHHLLVLAAG